MLDQSKLSAEQKLILSSSGNILVSASAGSGKTTMMIEKVMTLLINGVDIRRILIMTFTNDAASEMKSRLIENIYTELRAHSASSATLKKQLEYLHFANIGTMDSFWKVLYQKYFAVIGKDPSCSIVEPSEGALMLNKAIEKVIQKHIEANDEDFFKLAEALSTGRNLDKVASNIITLRNFMTAQIDEDAFVDSASKDLDKNSPMANFVWDNLRKRFVTKRADIQQFLTLFMEIDAQKFVEEMQNFLQSVAKLINANDYDEFNYTLQFLEAPPKIGNSIKKCPFTADYSAFVDVVRKLIADAKEYSDAYKDKEQSGIESAKLLELLQQTELEYSHIKKQSNLLDFNDLSKYAVEILKDEKTRSEIKESFDYIFVDEYQDTNYRQEALLEMISNGNNIFVVGDIKQAIYQFRNAEPAIFIDRKNRYDTQKTGTNIPLNSNYRSDERILKFVDNVCGELMTDSFGGVNYKATANFFGEAKYEQVDDLPPVNIAILEKEKVDKSNEQKVYTIKDGEKVSEEIEPDYAYVAGKIKELVGSHQIYNCKTKTTTTINYSDIAILVRKWKQGYGIGDALNSYNIPFNINNSEKKECKERELLVDYLSIIFNPTKDIRLTNVLLSEIGSLTPNELLKVRKGNTETTLWETISTYKGNNIIEDKISIFIKKLEQLQLLSSHNTVSELLSIILQDGYDAILMNKGGNVIGEVNAFIEFIAKSAINNSLEDFLDFYEQSYNGNASPKVNNAVTITTIFKSKGLEYPVVFLPCLSDNLERNRDDNIIYADSTLGIAVKSITPSNYSIKENFAVMTHKLKQKEINREEMVRVLYVALTRAKNHLFLSGMQGKQISYLEDATSIMDWINFSATKNPAIAVHFSYTKPTIFVSEKVNIVNKRVNLDNLTQKYAHEEATKTYAKMSVSQAIQEDEGEFSPPWSRVDKVDADLGTAYHTILQHMDFNGGKEHIQDVIDKLVKEGKLSADYASKVAISNLLGVLNWSVVKENLNSKMFREQPFMLYQSTNNSADKTLIQGVIDLFFVNEKNEAVVIDFKVTNASKEMLTVRYSKQLELYSLAVEKLMQVKVVKRYIYNLLSGCAIYI